MLTLEGSLSHSLGQNCMIANMLMRNKLLLHSCELLRWGCHLLRQWASSEPYNVLH